MKPFCFFRVMACALALVLCGVVFGSGADVCAESVLTKRPDGFIRPQNFDPPGHHGAPLERRVRPQLPKDVQHAIVAHISATLTNHDQNGVLSWSSTIRNLDSHEPLPANRYELKVVQLLDLPGQTAPAGATCAIPVIGAGGIHGFGSPWTRNLRARKLRLEVWDRLAKATIVQKEISLPSKADNFVNTKASHVAEIVTANATKKTQLVIESGKYLGRGAWNIQVASDNMPIWAGTYTYTWIYRFSNGNDRYYTLPKDINFQIPTGQSRTLLEPGQFYGPQDCDCAGLQQVDVEVVEKQSGSKKNYTIPVSIPYVEVVGLSVDTRTITGKIPVYLNVANHSDYNLLFEYRVTLSMHRFRSSDDFDDDDFDDYVASGRVMLSAQHTGEDRIVVPDLYEVFPNLHVDDRIICSEDATYSEPVALYGDVLIFMPSTSKCSEFQLLAYPASLYVHLSCR